MIKTVGPGKLFRVKKKLFRVIKLVSWENAFK